MKTLIFIISFIFLTGCSITGKNVYYFNANKQDDNSPDTIKIFIDAFGNLYPDKWTNNEYVVHQNVANSLINHIKNKPKSGKNFLCHNTTTEDESLLCDAILKHPEIPHASQNIFWKEAQSKLWAKVGKKIFKKATQNGKKDLFFLIHGFNNNFEESNDSFNLVKDKVRELKQENELLFVEIYWDGFTGKFPIDIWFKAQASGPLVGFQLRQLFREINISYKHDNINLPKVHIFTHSSGAFVAGALLGNPYPALPLLYNEDKCKCKYEIFGCKYENHDYDLFRNNRDGKNPQYPIPNFPEIRLGMIAAATSTLTYTGDMNSSSEMNKKAKTGILSDNTTLLFSINKNDAVLGKVLDIENNFGATGAGQSEFLYCKNTNQLNEREDINISTYAYDLNSSTKAIAESHTVKTYLDHNRSNAFFEHFLNIKYDKRNTIKCPNAK